MHYVHAGLELVDVDLAADGHERRPRIAPFGSSERRPSGERRQSGGNEELKATRKALSSLLLELEAEELQQEQRLLFLPDYLAGVGYPGNPLSDGVSIGGGGGGGRCRRHGSSRAPHGSGCGGCGRAPSSVPSGAVRVMAAAFLSLALALDVGAPYKLSSPRILQNSGWMVVLATAQVHARPAAAWHQGHHPPPSTSTSRRSPPSATRSKACLRWIAVSGVA